MTLWICRGCTAAYSVGAPRCPQCSSTDRIEEKEQNVPKITVAGGPSDAGAPAGFTASWGDDEPAAAEGSEQSSPSNSSETSSEEPPTSPETSENDPPKRARTTQSRSKKAPTGSSSAPSTGGDPTDGTSATASDTDKD
jgi:ribosomal protein L40E